MEKEQKNNEAPAPASTAVESAAATDAGKKPDNAPEAANGEHYNPPLGMDCKRIKTPAEKIFDFATYGGIGWVGNAALSTSLAYFMKYTKAGKPLYDKMVKGVANTLSPGNPKFLDSVNKNAEVAALIVGGTSLMLPVKMLEDNKSKVVRAIDKVIVGAKSLIGIRETQEEKLEKDAAFELLAQEPKQSWYSILRARFVGLAAVYATLNLVGPARNEKIENAVANAVNESFTKSEATKHFDQDKVRKVSKLATLDVLYSMVAAAGLYIDSHFFNPPKKDKKIQGSTLSPLSPPNEETHWIGHASKVEATEKPQKRELSHRKIASRVPAGSFREAELAREADTQGAQIS